MSAESTRTSLGFLEEEDLAKNIYDEFTKLPVINPENSFLQRNHGVNLPYEAERGFKFNGSWQPAKQFLREDSARCKATMDPRRTKSFSNIISMLDYSSTRQEDDEFEEI